MGNFFPDFCTATLIGRITQLLLWLSLDLVVGFLPTSFACYSNDSAWGALVRSWISGGFQQPNAIAQPTWAVQHSAFRLYGRGPFYPVRLW